MDKIFAPIKQRLLQYVEFKGIKKESFYKKTGISASNFKGSAQKSELGGEILVKIIAEFPEMNPVWLLTGEGPMLKTDSVMVSPGECLECKNKAARIDMLEAILEGKDELIQSQKDLIAELKKNTQARPAPVAKRVAM